VFLWHLIPVVYASFFLTGILKLGGAVSLGSFFDDIHIPEHLLQQPSTFDEDEKLWVWNYNGTPMYMDLDEDVRFRVVQVKYPPIPIEQEKNAKPFAPMQITGDVNADGLGLVAWWS
jgi:DNA-directed RNA polymerase III subunit RPC8